MDTEKILETSRRSLEGALSFPEVVKILLEADVEYYHLDYVALQQTCYSADGRTVVAPFALEALPPVAAELTVDELKGAIPDSQRHGQKFGDFSRRAMQAGVQGYHVFLRGQRVVYLGRKGDQHVEWFPGARP